MELEALREEMINWLSELTFADIEDPSEFEEYPTEVLAKRVNKFYDGGLEQFIEDGAL